MSLEIRYCNQVGCKNELEEGECNLRDGDQVDIYWFCPSCEWDERENGIDFDAAWNERD